MTETRVVLDVDIVTLFVIGLFAWWVKWLLSEEDEAEEEDAKVVMIIPALPGYFALSIDDEALEGAQDVRAILANFVKWPIIAWQVEENTALDAPLAVTTAGIEEYCTAIVWPDGRVHDQGLGLHDSEAVYAAHLLKKLNEKEVASAG